MRLRRVVFGCGAASELLAHFFVCFFRATSLGATDQSGADQGWARDKAQGTGGSQDRVGDGCEYPDSHTPLHLVVGFANQGSLGFFFTRVRLHLEVMVRGGALAKSRVAKLIQKIR